MCCLVFVTSCLFVAYCLLFVGGFVVCRELFVDCGLLCVVLLVALCSLFAVCCMFVVGC